MKYRKHKELTFSEIGIGCYGLSGAYGEVDLETYKKTLVHAYEQGVTFFDTADAYGRAEQILGEVVKNFRHEICIATKVGVKDSVKANLGRKYLIQACENSLRALQTDYIDLYQIHFDDPDTPVEETVSALEELVRSGKIRDYGIGHLSTGRVREYVKTGRISTVLIEFNALTRSAHAQLAPLCPKCDIVLIAFSVTGRGLLTGKFNADHVFEPGDIRNLDPQFQRERFISGLRVAQKLAEIGQNYGKTPAQVAIAWVLAQPNVACALTGPSKIAHLEENLGGSGWQIDPDDLEALGAFLDKEDAWLKEQQKTSVINILNQPLLSEPSAAFVDLIYAIETAINLKSVTEEEIMPVFYELYGLKKKLEEKNALEKLKRIQAKLNELFPIS